MLDSTSRLERPGSKIYSESLGNKRHVGLPKKMARDRSTVKRYLVALALLEMLEERNNFTGTKRVKTRHWIKQKGDMIVLAIDLRVAPSSWFHSFRFSTARRDCLYFLRRVIETFSHSPYRILTSTRNARSKYKQRTITMETCARSTMLDERHATSCNMVAKRVQHVGFNNVASTCWIRLARPLLYRGQFLF